MTPELVRPVTTVSHVTDPAADHPALAGLTVIESAQGIAGPYAAMLLAEQGAEILKIEAPSGDPARRLPGSHAWNRSKQTHRADIRTSSGREHLRRLCAAADVLISDCPLKGLGCQPEIVNAEVGVAPGFLQGSCRRPEYLHSFPGDSKLWFPRQAAKGRGRFLLHRTGPQHLQTELHLGNVDG
jgi:hypothetical protein